MILVVYWYVQFKSLYKDFVIACILIDFYKYLGFCNDETIYFGTVWYIQSLIKNRIVGRGSEYLHLQKVSDMRQTVLIPVSSDTYMVSGAQCRNVEPRKV